jgi:hypothetical protein
MLELPRDPGAAPIPVLAPDDTTVATATIAAGNASAALPTNSVIVEVCASDYCRMAFGISTIDATSGTRRIIPPGVSVYKVPASATHFAITQFGTSSGTVTVTKLI